MSANLADYPHVFPPPGFIRVDRNGSAAVAAGVTVRPAGSEIDIRNGFEGWIVLAGVELSSYAAGTFFRLLEGETPIRDYEAVTVPLGAPNTPAPLHIKLRPEVPFRLSVTNAGAGVLAARWRFYGWYYPTRGMRT